MSADEQDAAILRIVKERVAAKRERSLLENELRTIGTAFHELGESLRRLGPFVSGQNPSYHTDLLRKAECIDSAKAAQMLKRYLELDGTIRELDTRAKELGID